MIPITAMREILQEHALYRGESNTGSQLIIEGNLITDSRQVKPGDLFICIKGFSTDGHQFIPIAKQAGAILFIVEDIPQESGIDYIHVTDARKATALLAKLYYHDPTSQFTLIGVTGTNGKTTTSGLIAQLLKAESKKVGLIGTLGYWILDEYYPSERTTPDILELNAIFAAMAQAGCEVVVMEVSSHAIALDRVYGIQFDYACFTNLTRDHLDFHVSMENYAETKLQLFTRLLSPTGRAVINIEDAYGKQFAAAIPTQVTTLGAEQADWSYQTLHASLAGTTFAVQTRTFQQQYTVPLIGEFNVTNALTALIIANMIAPKANPADWQRPLQQLVGVPGRLEAIANDRGFGVFVDYAHTPDALENVLQTLQSVPHGRIITVVGAGGNRDKGKRPEMTSIALQYSGLVILTNDNPREEEPADIIRDMVATTDPFAPYWVIRDRQAAIQTALRMARPQDIVLIAGKGHETYQEIHGVKTHFDDREVAKAALQLRDQEATTKQLSLPIDPLQLALLFNLLDIPKEVLNFSDQNLLYSISTDSRKVSPQSLFVALKGEKFDGNDYVSTVLQEEQVLAITNVYPTGHSRAIYHEDSLQFLATLAQKYISLFDVIRIGITGSTGKTTTKELLSHILSYRYPVLKTHANENNQIGLPQTIFRLQPVHRYAVLELGTNHHGEIAHLRKICQPQHAIIVSVGPSHLEYFGDELGVLQEKLTIFDEDQTRYIPGDDERFNSLEMPAKKVGFMEGNQYRIASLEREKDGWSCTINHVPYSLPITAAYFALNAAFGIAVAQEIGFSTEEIQTALKEPFELAQRMQIHRSGSNTLLIDCYNANPVSMKAAIQHWLDYEPSHQHYAILGDMLELGEESEYYHRQIEELLEKSKMNGHVISVGTLSKHYHARQHFETVEELLNSNALSELTEAVVLIKASHGIHLEKTIGKI